MTQTEQIIDDSLMNQYLSNLSEIIIGINDKFEFNDKIKISISKIWFPENHDFCVVTNHLTSMTNNLSCDVISVIRRSNMNQNVLSNHSMNEIEKLFISQFDSILFRFNENQIKSGDFYFISRLVPSVQELQKNNEKFKKQLIISFESSLMPKIAYELSQNNENQIESNVYAIKLSDPVLSVSNEDNQRTFLNIDYEVLNRNLDLIMTSSVTLDFPFENSGKLFWIYDIQNDFDYQKTLNESFQEIINENEVHEFKFDKITLLLVDYTGLPSKYHFLLNDGNSLCILKLFKLLYENNEFNDFIDEVIPINSDETVLKISLNGTDNKLFIGTGGIASSIGPIYDKTDIYHDNLKKAIEMISHLCGFISDEIVSFVGLWDKRKTNSIFNELQKKGIIK